MPFVPFSRENRFRRSAAADIIWEQEGRGLEKNGTVVANLKYMGQRVMGKWLQKQDECDLQLSFSVWTNYRLKLQGPCLMDLTKFPFDSVTCSLTFNSFT